MIERFAIASGGFRCWVYFRDELDVAAGQFHVESIVGMIADGIEAIECRQARTGEPMAEQTADDAQR